MHSYATTDYTHGQLYTFPSNTDTCLVNSLYKKSYKKYGQQNRYNARLCDLLWVNLPTIQADTGILVIQ